MTDRRPLRAIYDAAVAAALCLLALDVPASSGLPSVFVDAAMAQSRTAELLAQPLETLQAIGHRFGMDDSAVEACVKDQAQLDKLKSDLQFASEQLRVEVTPTFFVNGEMLKGTMTFEDLDKRLLTLLRR